MTHYLCFSSLLRFDNTEKETVKDKECDVMAPLIVERGKKSDEISQMYRDERCSTKGSAGSTKKSVNLLVN